MIKKRLVEWALETIRSYLEENGTELATQLIAWLVSIIEGVGEEKFALPEPVAGCEELCDRIAAELLSGDE